MNEVDILKHIVNPWHEALKNPAEVQQKTLEKLLEGYAKTDYGKKHRVHDVKDGSMFRANFPTINYHGLRPYLEEVKAGNYSAILPEPEICWVMTRGSTGKSKVLPVTKTHIGQIFWCGARAITNFALRTNCMDVLTGKKIGLLSRIFALR